MRKTKREEKERHAKTNGYFEMFAMEVLYLLPQSQKNMWIPFFLIICVKYEGS